MITEYYQRVDDIQVLRAQLQPHITLEKGRLIEVEVFDKTIQLMLDVIDDMHWGSSIMALQEKVCMNEDPNPASLDYQVRSLHRRVDRLSMGVPARG